MVCSGRASHSREIAEASAQDSQQGERKPETFTSVCRHGEGGNRVEKDVTGILHHVLTPAQAL